MSLAILAPLQLQNTYAQLCNEPHESKTLYSDLYHEVVPTMFEYYCCFAAMTTLYVLQDDGLEDEDIIMARRRALLPHNSMGRYLNIPAAIPYRDQDDGDDDDEEDDEEDDGEDDGEDEEGNPLPGHGIGLDGSIEVPPPFIEAYNYPGDAVHDRPTQRRRVR